MKNNYKSEIQTARIFSYHLSRLKLSNIIMEGFETISKPNF